MKNFNSVLASILIVCSGVLQAQTASTAAHRANTQIIDFILSLQEKSIVAVAEIMPAEKYSFAPTNGEFAGVRTFR